MNKNYLQKAVVLLIVMSTIPILSSSITTIDAQIIEKTEDMTCQNYDLNIVDMINQVNDSLIYKYLDGLMDFSPRYTGTIVCNQAAEYIYNEFNKMGLYAYIDEWKHLGYRSQNVVANINGTDPHSDEVFILCAHYDAAENSLGANDDGSGVAMMLSIASVLHHYSFNHTIRFVAFAGEELGMLGSQKYVRKAYDQNENIIAAINLDTLGYTETERGGRYVQMLCPERNMWISTFFQNITKTYNNYINLNIEILPNHPCDHDSFTQFGYDAIMLMQYDPLVYFHGPDDVIDHINFTYLNKITKLVTAAIASLADKPIELQVRIVTPMEDSFYLFDKRIFKHSNLYLSRARFGRTYILGSCIVRVNITTNEEVEKIIYCIDDFHQLTYKSKLYPDKPIEWRIRGYDSALTGKHKLGVYVYTVTGKVAYDEMDITAFTFNRYYWWFL
jgi:hypothetical protein